MIYFLLKLIQNVNNNTYNYLSPTLSFFYKLKNLHINCNKVGFTVENIKAIYAISRNTKSSKMSDKEYISKKGIGFKSVFKTINIV